MPVSEAKKKSDAKYVKEHRAQIVINVSKAQRQQINDFCRDRGGTATLIKKLLRDEMLKNGVRPLEPNEEYTPEDV